MADQQAQHELFGEATLAVAAPNESLETDPKSTDLESPARDEHPFDSNARAYQDGFNAFLAMKSQIDESIDAHKAQWGNFAGKVTVDWDKLVDDHATSIIDALCNCASSSFGYAGRPVTIDQREVRHLFWPDRYMRHRRREEGTRDETAFSPIAIWTYLKTTYATQGHRLAKCEAAKDLLSFLPFGRMSKDQIKHSGKQVVFDVSFYAEKNDRSSLGDYRISHNWRYSTGMTIPRAMRAFGTLLAWSAGLEVLPDAVEQDIRAYTHWETDSYGVFNLRDTKWVGPIAIVFFKSKLEVRVPNAVAEQLNLFLAEFAAERLAELMSNR